MKERPILFSAPMVRALLAGTKTQTRRVVKPQPSSELLADYAEIRALRGSYRTDAQMLSDCVPCPYGVPGDLLWVRETWYCDDYRVQNGPYLKPDDLDVTEAQDYGTLVYRASSGDRPYEAEQPVWRPSIHMPRWASRITLRITDVRVERLQDISEADAMAEGAEPILVPPDGGSAPHVEGFRALWESINGDGSWGANPWLWVVSFERVTP